jgi:hypothetical protein
MLLFFMLFVIDTVFSIAYQAVATSPGEIGLMAVVQLVCVVAVVSVVHASPRTTIAANIAAILVSWAVVYTVVTHL